MASTNLTPFINQHRARRNYDGKRITIELEACRRVLLVLKNMLSDVKSILQNMVKQ